MELGAFSVSLAVKDLAASRAFYEALGLVKRVDGVGTPDEVTARIVSALA